MLKIIMNRTTFKNVSLDLLILRDWNYLCNLIFDYLTTIYIYNY